jgi:hypothetical protein
MAKEKSILDKFTDTMKGLADSASQALKSEEPARVDESAVYMPFATEGMVSDLFPVPPIATQPVRRKRAPGEKGKRRAAKRSRKTAAAEPASQATAKSARARTKAATRKSGKENKPEDTETGRCEENGRPASGAGEQKLTLTKS